MDNYSATQQILGAQLGGVMQCGSGIDKQRDASQVDEAFKEHAYLLNQLSEELAVSRDRFRAVLMPEAPTGCPSEASPEPIRSPLAQAIVGHSRMVHTMLLELRSINDRSTV